MLSFASKHHFFIHFIAQNFKILPLSALANTLHWTPLLPSDSDFEHDFMNDKRWPLSCFLCGLLSAGLSSSVLVFIEQCFIFTALIRHLYHFPHVLGIISRGPIVQCIKHILENCFWQWFWIFIFWFSNQAAAHVVYACCFACAWNSKCRARSMLSKPESGMNASHCSLRQIQLRMGLGIWHTPKMSAV